MFFSPLDQDSQNEAEVELESDSHRTSPHFLFVFSCSPICYPWEGGKLLAHSPDYDEIVVTREDYEENGHFICEEKFDT